MRAAAFQQAAGGNGTRTPPIHQEITNAYSRAQGDRVFHAAFVGQRTVIEAWGMCWVSGFQVVPEHDLGEFREKLEALRADDRMARLLDLALAERDVARYRANHLAVWALEQSIFLKLGPSGVVGRADVPPWTQVLATMDERAMPAWASGRVKTYLRARASCDALLLAGMLSLRAGPVSDRPLWQKRWRDLGEMVAMLPDDVWEGASAFERVHYGEIIRIHRRLREAKISKQTSA